MNPLPFSVSPSRRGFRTLAFTLIELLVVISIIAVLAGLLLPVVNTVMKNARKVATRETATQIVTAVNSYQTEYSQLPVPNTVTAGQDYTYGVASNGNADNHNLDLFNVLRALNHQDTTSPTGTLNSRRISYFEARNVKSSGAPKDGFILSGTPMGNKNVPLKAGDLIDPFGNMYCVRIDANYSNVLVNPYSDAGQNASDTVTGAAGGDDAGQAKLQLRTAVVAYSVGEDGQVGDKGAVGTPPYSPTPGDDVDSWQ